MGRPYSLDLRERVVAAVERGGLSRREAAERFGIGVSSAIRWVERARKTGSAAPGQNGRAQAEGDRGGAPGLASCTGHGARLHHPRAGGGVRRARPQGRLPIGVEFRSHREAELQKKASSPASATGLTLLADGGSGSSIRTASLPSAWSSSTRVCCRAREEFNMN